MPIPQRSQTRRRSSGRPGGSSEGWPQREQKRIGRWRPSPGAAVHDRSIRMRAVTRSDQNTEPVAMPAPRGECTASEAKNNPNLHRNASLPRAPRRTRVAPHCHRADSLRGASDQGVGLAVQQELWGPETIKAVENFPVSGERLPTPVVRWLGRIKAAAARANAELGLLDQGLADRIAAAGDAIAHGEHDDQFPIDVFQTGSGTSSNMNANEVIATIAGDEAHANDHVNMGQSSNDVFPSAVHLAALAETRDRLLPALERLEQSFARKADEFSELVKAGRTHMMDAVPVTLGQEMAGYAAQIRLGRERVAATLPRVAQIPLGGTATGTGLNTHEEFAERMRAKLADATGVVAEAPADP